MEHPLTRRLLPLSLVALLAAAGVSCNRNQETTNVYSVDAEEFQRIASDAGGYSAAPANSGRRESAPAGGRQAATTPEEPGANARMTPFLFNSIDDAPWPEIFNDSNKYQYPFAEKYGIEPITDISKAYFTRQPVMRIATNSHYSVDTLTHSIPYLVPRAGQLLDDIGADFISRLKKRGIRGYRIRVTSLLRTPASVKKLRRVNVNAADSSAHQFATTFDISYNGFDRASDATPTTDEELKRTLAETLLTMRKAERCMVKYESKTHCFHVTVTK